MKSLRISVACSCKSHLVHVNEQFEFIISSNRKQKLKVVISQDGEAILKELTVIPPARIAVSLPYPGFVRCSAAPNDPEYRSHLETLLYFDTSYAAGRITIPVMIGVGFTDIPCPPSAVYTIYNELKGPKFISNKIRHGHASGPPEYYQIIDIWLSSRMAGE